VKNNEVVPQIVRVSNSGGPLLCSLGKNEPDLSRSVTNTERSQQSEVVVDRMDEADVRRHELVVTQLSQRLAPNGVIGNAGARPREQGQKGGPISPRKIEAIFELPLGDPEPRNCIRDPAARHKSLIHPLNRRQQFARAVRNNERDFRVGKLRSHRGDRRHGQDQVADPFQLDEEDVQPIAPSASPTRKRPAGVRGNGSR